MGIGVLKSPEGSLAKAMPGAMIPALGSVAPEALKTETLNPKP